MEAHKSQSNLEPRYKLFAVSSLDLGKQFNLNIVIDNLFMIELTSLWKCCEGLPLKPSDSSQRFVKAPL